MSQYVSLIWLAVLIAVFYFFLIRPQQQRVKRHQELISSLKVGDKVVTIGGIYGKIKALRGDKVVLEIADGVKINLSKNAIARREDGEKEE